MTTTFTFTLTGAIITMHFSYQQNISHTIYRMQFSSSFVVHMKHFILKNNNIHTAHNKCGLPNNKSSRAKKSTTLIDMGPRPENLPLLLLQPARSQGSYISIYNLFIIVKLRILLIIIIIITIIIIIIPVLLPNTT